MKSHKRQTYSASDLSRHKRIIVTFSTFYFSFLFLCVHSLHSPVMVDGTVYSVCIKEVTEPLVLHTLRGSSSLISFYTKPSRFGRGLARPAHRLISSCLSNRARVSVRALLVGRRRRGCALRVLIVELLF